MADYLIVQLRINRAKEPDIVRWIEGRENRTQALLGLVRVHLGLMPADPEAQPPLPSTLDVCAIRSILDEYTPQLRKVLAALLDQKLRGLVIGGGTVSEEADPALDAKIDAMF